jgi:hypothetical protein
VTDSKSSNLAGDRSGVKRSISSLFPLMLGALLVAFLATTAGSSSADWLFQSPVSPISPIGPAPTESPAAPTESPIAPEGTVTGPALVAVPAAPNFAPWLVGILLVAAIVVAAMLWSRRRGKGGPDA